LSATRTDDILEPRVRAEDPRQDLKEKRERPRAGAALSFSFCFHDDPARKPEMEKGNPMTMIRFAMAAGAAATLTVAAHAGVPVQVTINGEVEFNQIGTGDFGQVNAGDDATMTFLVDSDIFVNDDFVPTRGYEIDQSSYSFSFDSGSIVTGLQDPFPGTPYFVLRNDDPAVDGFFIGDNTNNGFNGIASDETGLFGQFAPRFSVTYGDDPLDSLDILDAVGSYDFDGLTVFGFAVTDGPFDAMGLVFSDMTIEIVPAPATLALLAPLGLFGRRRRRG